MTLVGQSAAGGGVSGRLTRSVVFVGTGPDPSELDVSGLDLSELPPPHPATTRVAASRISHPLRITTGMLLLGKNDIRRRRSRGTRRRRPRRCGPRSA